MKTSWDDLQAIEDYSMSSGSGGDRLLFQARLILEPELRESLHWQRATYTIVNDYARAMLRKDIEAVAHRIATDKKHEPFRRRILRIFNK